MKQKKILGINTHFNLANTDELSFSQIGFNDKISLYDFDTVIFSSFNFFFASEVKKENYAEGLHLSSSSVYTYSVIFEKLRKQVIDLLDSGKNIYVMLDQEEKIYYIDDFTKYNFNCYSYLPIDFNYDVLVGSEFIIEKKEPYFSFFSKIKDYLLYKNILNSDFFEKLVITKNSSKIIGGLCNCRKGKIIFIPSFNYSRIINFNGNQKRDNRDEEFINALLELENNLSTTVEEKLPEWTNGFYILNEKEILSQISDTKNEVKKLQDKLESQNKELELIRNYKYLLTATGKPLELIVKQVLKEIGFDLLETEDNRSDVIAKYKNIDIVAEIKGLTKSAGEKNAAQLEKWVSEFIEVNEKEPKAILIVNGYCNLPLNERKEPVFPNQMLGYAIKREQCLISTYQLLKLFIEIKENPDKSDILISELLNTVGIYEKYD